MTKKATVAPDFGPTPSSVAAASSKSSGLKRTTSRTASTGSSTRRASIGRRSSARSSLGSRRSAERALTRVNILQLQMSYEESSDSISLRWIMAQFFMSIYYLIVVPFRIAFMDDSNSYTFQSMLPFVVLDYFVDMLLWKDMYDKQNNYKRKCQREALGSSGDVQVVSKFERLFGGLSLWDVIALVPFEIFTLISFNSPDVFQVSSLLRLNKLVRGIQISIATRNLQHKFRSFLAKASPAVWRMISLVVYSCFIGHVYGCFWYYVGRTNTSGENWLHYDRQRRQEALLLKAPLPSSKTDHYVRSVYFAITSICTIGYGDIFPRTSVELVVSLLFMLTGIAVQSAFVSNMSSIISNVGVERTAYQEKIDDITKVVEMHSTQSRRNILSEIAEFAEFMWTRQKSINREELIDKLPAVLRKRILRTILVEMLAGSRYLNSYEDPMLILLADRFSPRLYAPREIVYKAGDFPTHFYVLLKGGVLIRGKRSNGSMSEGILGLVACLKEQPHEETVEVCNDFIEMFSCPLVDLTHLTDEYIAAPEECDSPDESQLSRVSSKGSNSEKGPVTGWRRTSLQKLQGFVKARKALVNVGDVKGAAKKPAEVLVWDENNPVRRRFTLVSLIFLLYYGFVVLPRIGYISPYKDVWEFRYIFLMEHLIDVFFLGEMTLRFIYYTRDKQFGADEKITRRAIALHYLRNDFVFDFLSIIPFELSCIYSDRVLYSWALGRLNRLIRFVRFGEYFSNFKHVMLIYPFAQRLDFTNVKFVLLIPLFGLWFASLWFSIAMINGWQYVDKAVHNTQSMATLIIRAIYWTFVTITTLGYGDIVPLTTTETFVVSLIMLCAVPVYSGVLAYISSSATYVDKSNVDLIIFKESCQHYLEQIGYPRDKAQEVTAYFDFCFSRSEQRNAELSQLLEYLPPGLRTRAYGAVYGHHLTSLRILDGCKPQFFARLATKMVYQIIPPQEELFYRMERANSMYFLLSGSVDLFGDYKKQILSTINPGQSFGVVECILNFSRTTNAHATKFSEVLLVDQAEFSCVLNDFPNDKSTVLEAAAKLHRKTSQVSIQTNLRSKKLTRIFAESKTSEETIPSNVYVPGCTFRVVWRVVYIMLLIYQVVNIPYMIGFHSNVQSFADLKNSPFTILYLSIHFLIDCFFLTDIYLRLYRFAYRDVKTGMLVYTREEITKQYRSSDFMTDCIASFPIGWIVLLTGNVQVCNHVSLIKAARFGHLVAQLNNLETYLEREKEIHSSVLRISKFYCYILFLCHYIACAWYFLGIYERKSNIDSEWKDSLHLSSEFGDYMKSIYWAVITINNVGYGDIYPTSNLETGFTLAVIAIGISMYAAILANMANIVAHSDRSAVLHQKKVEKLREFSSSKRLPATVHHMIFEYYDNLWRRQKGLEEDIILKTLPVSIRTDIQEHLCGKLLRKIDVFKSFKLRMLNSILASMKRKTYLTGIKLCIAGDPCDELIVITDGVAKTSNSTSDNTPFVLVRGGVVAMDEFRAQGVFPYTATAVQTTYASILEQQHLEEAIRLSRYVKMDFSVQSTRSGSESFHHNITKNIHLNNKLARMASAIDFVEQVDPRVIMPNNPKRIQWEMLMLIVILAVAICLPCRLAFDSYPMQSQYWWHWLIFDRLCDMLICINIYLCYDRFAYMSDSGMLTNSSRIRELYRAKLMWKDIISLLPFDLVALFISTPVGYFIILPPRLLRLFVLVRIPYYIRVIRGFEHVKSIKDTISRIVQLILGALYIMHVTACVWYICDDQKENATAGWVEKYGVKDMSTGQKYLMAVYWVFMTVSSVGYGNITPSTFIETVVTIVVVLLGATLYGGLIAYVSVHFSNQDERIATFNTKVKEIANFSEYLDIPPSVEKQVQSYFEYICNDKKGLDVNEVMDVLPNFAKEMVSFHCNGTFVKLSDHFRDLSIDCTTAITCEIDNCLYVENLRILFQGEEATELITIRKGRMDGNVVDQDSGESTKARVFCPGDTIGYSGIRGGKSPMTISTIEICEVLSISISALFQILEKYPEDREKFYSVIELQDQHVRP